MSIEPNNPELLKAMALIDEIVQVHSNSLSDTDLEYKLDAVERTIELIRIRRKKLKYSLLLEEYIQGDLFVDNANIHFYPPEKLKGFGSGIPPSYYQPKLLLFLLLYHREKYRVIDIIEMFINKIWDDLGTLDFKKTDTGVFRCYTNIRFAAHTLRDAGLIRFTQKEAFKTWELSLLGFLAASIVLEQDHSDWTSEKLQVNQGHSLHKDIVKAIVQVKDYNDFVYHLRRICLPDVKVFNTFENMLKEAYALLLKYQAILNKPGLTKKERQQESTKLIKQLEGLDLIDLFCKELSRCINVNRLLNTS